MMEGAEAPGPPKQRAEPAVSADTAQEVSAGRPAGYASDEGTHEPLSGPSHGERKKGGLPAAPVAPARECAQRKVSRPQKVAARCVGTA